MLLINSKACYHSENRVNVGVNFDTYRNLQRHRAVLPAIARHLVVVDVDKLYHAVIVAAIRHWRRRRSTCVKAGETSDLSWH